MAPAQRPRTRQNPPLIRALSLLKTTTAPSKGDGAHPGACRAGNPGAGQGTAAAPSVPARRLPSDRSLTLPARPARPPPQSSAAAAPGCSAPPPGVAESAGREGSGGATGGGLWVALAHGNVRHPSAPAVHAVPLPIRPLHSRQPAASQAPAAPAPISASEAHLLNKQRQLISNSCLPGSLQLTALQLDRRRIAAVPPPRRRQLLRRRVLVVLLRLCIFLGKMSECTASGRSRQ